MSMLPVKSKSVHPKFHQGMSQDVSDEAYPYVSKIITPVKRSYRDEMLMNAKHEWYLKSAY